MFFQSGKVFIFLKKTTLPTKLFDMESALTHSRQRIFTRRKSSIFTGFEPIPSTFFCTKRATLS